MKRWKQIIQPLKIDEMNLPSKNDTLPILTVSGANNLLIENIYSLVEYREKTITLRCEAYMITINGNNLRISFMYPHELMLVGEIENISFHSQ